MALERIAVTIPKEVLEALEERAKVEDGNKSRIVVAAIRSYLKGPSITEQPGPAQDNNTVVLQSKIEKLEREVEHKNDLLNSKDETIRRVTADSERYAKARDSEIERYERIAGAYGTAAIQTNERLTKFLEQFSPVLENVTRQLPSAVNVEAPGEVEEEKPSRSEGIEVDLPKTEEARPKRSFRDRLFGRKAGGN